MDLTFALDELLSTGWSCLDSSGVAHGPDGRAYPTADRVKQEFAAAGYELSITRVTKFNCFRAEWRETGGLGETEAVVGHSEAEVAVHALTQLRRSLAGGLVGAGA